MNDDDEIDPAEGVMIDASFILDWLESWKFESACDDSAFQHIERSAAQVMILKTKEFILETVAEHHKNKFTLPNFNEKENDE